MIERTTQNSHLFNRLVDIRLFDRLLHAQQSEIVYDILRKRMPFINPTMEYFLADRKSVSYANTRSTECFALLMTIPSKLPASSLTSMMRGVSRLRALDAGRDVNVFLVVIVEYFSVALISEAHMKKPVELSKSRDVSRRRSLQSNLFVPLQRAQAQVGRTWSHRACKAKAAATRNR